MTIDGVKYLNPDAVNGLNLYAYCLNNPVSYFDETGCLAAWIIPVCLVVAGAVIGGICGASLSVATPGNMEIEYPTPETNPNIIVPNKPLEDTNIINTNPGNEENLSPKPETKDLSLGERFTNIIIWSSIRACFGCTVGFVVSPCLFFMGETAIARVIMAASIAFGLIFQTVSIAFGVFIDMPSENPLESIAPQLPRNNQEFRYPY